MDKILHFDRFLAEKDRELLTVEIYGELYEIPAEIPAIVPLKMARAERMRDASARGAEYQRLIFEAADALFGEAQIDRICAKGISARELAQLVQKCFEMINGADTDDDAEELDDESSRTSVSTRAKKK